ncbi:MAG: glycerate kinase type-2 family protein [Desulfovibrio sp.]|uniref:glycerate kinase type-2 family protein n=1 Tax=Desulfovibrio sp. 7SRBS1 TaxID=3378064 RepID=UPI003B3CEA2E
MTDQTVRQHLDEIFQAGLARVNPLTMITSRVHLDGDTLRITLEDRQLEVDLSQYNRIWLLGAGKASGRMALAFETILGERIEKGFVCVKYGHTEKLKRCTLVEAGHPVPDENGVAAARQILEMAGEADERTLVINCISGGGSALLPCPAELCGPDCEINLTLADKQAVTNALLSSGVSIAEINCVRKHLSGIKGGRLLQAMYPARSLNFILSDVIGDDLGSIASGMTSCDTTTYTDALAICTRHNICDRIPASVMRCLEKGAEGSFKETVKPGAPELEPAENILIGTNRQAVLECVAKAKELGYNAQPLTAQLSGEARNAAHTLADIAKDVAGNDMFLPKPACIIVGGETVVTLQGKGKGGRNQEMALAFLENMRSWNGAGERIHFLAASTDGNDGPTDAAGAFADAAIFKDAPDMAAKIDDYLAANDSYHFHCKAGSIYKTGPTNTNVCDIQIILVR